MPDPLLSISSAEVDIDGSRILRGVTLEVRPNELVALMGRNGVGKTTTLRALMGLRPLRSGVMTLGGASLAGLTSDGRARAGLGYVPQGRDIFPHLTVEENLRISLVVHKIKGSAAREAIDEVYTLFPILKQFVARKGGVLSGGQQQQLAIGRALLTKPKVLLLDEPTEGIQPNIIKDIGKVIRMLADRGNMAIVLVEQYYDFAEALADRYVVMERGEVIASGPGSEMQAKNIRQLVAI